MESRAHVLPVGPPVEPRYQIGREGAIALLADELAEQLAQGRGSQTVAEALAAVAHARRDRGAVIFLDEAEALHAQPEAAGALRAVMRASSRTVTLLSPALSHR
ncbi:MAG: hypothetical protein ACLP01_18830 [Solirubrobacteraceae bacterium]